MKAAARLDALERASGAGIVLHMPDDGDDHAGEWARLLATGKPISVIRYHGLNSEACDAFFADKPDPRTSAVVVVNKAKGRGDVR